MIYPVLPVPKPRMTRRDKWAQRECVLRYRQFKDQVRAADIKLEIPCKVIFWIPMPESWSMKKKVFMVSTPHTVKPDIDNLVKALLDSLYVDDCGVWSIWSEKRWSQDGYIEVVSMDKACSRFLAK